MRVLFQGDSVTSGHRSTSENNLGSGWVFLISEYYKAIGKNVEVINRGVGGNRSVNLVERWEEDALNLEFDLMTIMVGINDVWHYVSGHAEFVTNEIFEKNYRYLLKSVLDKGKFVVMFGSYICHIGEDKKALRQDFDDKLNITRKLAKEFDLPFYDLDKILNSGAYGYQKELTLDSIHPSEYGNSVLKEIWVS
ncbi:MAG: GDSL-type esterase/lipase family protein, partial [Clostridia bacterium]